MKCVCMEAEVQLLQAAENRSKTIVLRATIHLLLSALHVRVDTYCGKE